MKFIATQALLRQIALLRAEGRHQSRLAIKIGIPPTRLSEIVHGVYLVRRDDPRILKLCGLINLPFDEAFVEAKTDRPAA